MAAKDRSGSLAHPEDFTEEVLFEAGKERLLGRHPTAASKQAQRYLGVRLTMNDWLDSRGTDRVNLSPEPSPSHPHPIPFLEGREDQHTSPLHPLSPWQSLGST